MQELEPAKKKLYFTLIQDSLVKIEQRMRDLLGFAKQQQLSFEKININEILERSIFFCLSDK